MGMNLIINDMTGAKLRQELEDLLGSLSGAAVAAPDAGESEHRERIARLEGQPLGVGDRVQAHRRRETRT